MSVRSRRVPFVRGIGGLAIAVVLLACGIGHAHEFSVLDAVLVLKSDGTWHADLRLDVDALALGARPSTPSEQLASTLRGLNADAFEAAVERARVTIERRVRVRFDERVVRPTVVFPDRGTARLEASPEPTVLGTTARLEGLVPPDARVMTFFASRSFGPVRLTVLDQSAPGAFEAVLSPGERSAPYELGSAGTPTGSTVRVPTFATYLGLGFEHILPLGTDHILFVLGLFLLGRRWRPLLIQVSAFTLAHTLTLAMAMLEWVRLPASVVEPLIALSIAWVAIENVFSEEPRPWRPFVVFGFGLLHGLGFAGALTELGLPSGRFVPALVGFNVGVELGQLAVVGLAFLAVGWWRNRRWYRRAIVVPGSLVIGLIGLYWTVERIGMFG